MSLKIKGVTVVGNKITSDMFDVSIDIIKKNRPVDDGFIIFTRDDTEEEFSCTVIRHPEMYTIDEDNWVNLLVHELAISETKSSLIPRGHIKKNGIYKITTKPNIGQRYFRFHGKGQDYVIMVDFGDKPMFTRGLRLDTVTDLSKKSGSVKSYIHIFHDHLNIVSDLYNEEGLCIGNQKGELIFDEPLDTMEQLKIYLNYNISQVLHERAVKAVLSEQTDGQAFRWKEVFGFHYIESQDGSIRISPWENAEVNLLWVMNNFLLNHDHALMKDIRRSLIDDDRRDVSLFKMLLKLKAALMRSKS